MEKKITIAENFAIVKAFLEENNAPLSMVEFIVDRAEKSVRKSSSGSRKITDEQKELRDLILTVLEQNGSPMSISEMMKSNDTLATLSTSKISGNITPMLVNGKNPNPQGRIVRSLDRKVAKFAIC